MPASRTYTPAEANALVPWLISTFDEIHRLQTRLKSTGSGPGSPARQAHVNGHSEMSSRISRTGGADDAARERLHELLASIAEKDIEVRDIATGLVDFPGERDGRDIWLCWRLGEPSVSHWHEIDTGFASRQPL
jgi:hypothetical protein